MAATGLLAKGLESSVTDVQAEPQNGQSADTNRPDGQPQEMEPGLAGLVPVLNGIESAIRDLVSQERSAQNQGRGAHEVRVLEAQEGMALWAQAMFWAALASTLLTFVAVVLIWRTLIHTRRAAEAAAATVDEMEDANAAAVRAAQAAEGSVEVAREATARQLRAYLVVEVGKLNVFKVGQKIAARFEIVNMGQTPAYNILQVSGLQVAGEEFPDEEAVFARLSIEEIKIRFPATEFVMGRLGGVTKESDEVLSVEEHDSIISGRQRLFVYGNVIYDDIFGECRMTTFCWSFSGAETSSMNAHQYTKYNRAT